MELVLGALAATAILVPAVWLAYARASGSRRSLVKFLLLGVEAPNLAEADTPFNCFFSGLCCFAWSLILFSLTAVEVAAFVALFGYDDPPRVFLWLMFALGLMSGMAFVKGWYYLVRSAVRLRKLR
jgi:hypothetical protein